MASLFSSFYHPPQKAAPAPPRAQTAPPSPKPAASSQMGPPATQSPSYVGPPTTGGTTPATTTGVLPGGSSAPRVDYYTVPGVASPVVDAPSARPGYVTLASAVPASVAPAQSLANVAQGVVAAVQVPAVSDQLPLALGLQFGRRGELGDQPGPAGSTGGGGGGLSVGAVLAVGGLGLAALYLLRR